MNLDEVMEGWRSQDASTFFGVEKTLLRQALGQGGRVRRERRSLPVNWPALIGR